MFHLVKTLELKSAVGGVVESLAFSPDGELLCSGTRDGGIEVWDCRTGEAVWRFPASRYPVRELCFSRRGTLFAAVCGPAFAYPELGMRPECDLVICNLLTQSIVAVALEGPPAVPGARPSVQFDAREVAAVCGTIRRLDVDTGRELDPLPPEAGADPFLWCADGRIICGSVSGPLRVWDPETNRLHTLEGAGSRSRQIGLLGTRQFVSVRGDDAFVWALPDVRVVALEQDEAASCRMALLPTPELVTLVRRASGGDYGEDGDRRGLLPIRGEDRLRRRRRRDPNGRPWPTLRGGPGPRPLARARDAGVQPGLGQTGRQKRAVRCVIQERLTSLGAQRALATRSVAGGHRPG